MKQRLSISITMIFYLVQFAELSSQPDDPNTMTKNQSVFELLNQAEINLELNLDSSLFYAHAAYEMASDIQNQELKYKSSKIIADAWYYRGDLTQAIDSYRLSAGIARELYGENSNEFAARISDVGYCFYELKIQDLAIENYLRALDIFKARDNVAEISNQLNNLGSAYFNWGNYNMAIEYFSKTLSYDIEIGDSLALSTSYNNIGKVYETWGYYDLAVEHYSTSINYLGLSGNESRKAIRLSNIGTTYYKLNDYEEALKYLNLAIEIDQQQKNKYKIAIRKNEIANVQIAKGEYEKAINYNEDALQILFALNKKESIAIVMKDLGRIYFEIFSYQKAEEYLSKSITRFHKIGSIINEMDGYKLLSEVYEKTGNFEQAIEVHSKFDVLKDSIFNLKTHKQLANYRIRYETEKKERENQVLKNDIKIKKREQRTLMIVGAMMVLLTILLFFLLRLKSRTLIQNRKLHEQDQKLAQLELEKTEIEKQNLQDKVFAEQQLNRLQREKHEAEIQLKNRELVSSTLQLVNKNEALTKIKNKIKSHNTAIPENAYKDLIQIINVNSDFDQNWKRFRLEFDKLNPGFFDRIRNAYPDFSDQFFRLSAFLRIDLSTKEIAQLMNVSVAAVNKNRQRLRKKLNLEAEADLQTFMKSI